MYLQIKPSLLFQIPFLCTDYVAHSFRKACKTDFGSNIKIVYTSVSELQTEIKDSQKNVPELQKYTLKTLQYTHAETCTNKYLCI